MARASSTRSRNSRPSTFSANLNKLLKPLLTGAKREAEIVPAPGVRGKVIRLPSDTLMMIVEQKGKDIWRGGFKSLSEAKERGVAGFGVDNVLLQRAQKAEIKVVAVVVEELCWLALVPVEEFFNQEHVRTRANWRGRSIRILTFDRFHHRFLKPPLRKRKPRAIACETTHT